MLEIFLKTKFSDGYSGKKGDHWGPAGVSTNKPYHFNTDWLGVLIQEQFEWYKALEVLAD